MDRTYSQGHVAVHTCLPILTFSFYMYRWSRIMGSTPPWWHAANSNLSRAAIQAAYDRYFDSSSNESSPPSSPIERPAQVPRLRVSTTVKVRSSRTVNVQAEDLIVGRGRATDPGHAVFRPPRTARTRCFARWTPVSPLPYGRSATWGGAARGERESGWWGTWQS